MEKLKQGDIVIIDYYKFSQPKKVEVLEETETTYLLLDMDYEKGRDFIVDANYITEEETKRIMDEFKSMKPTFVQADLVEPRVEVLAAKFRITKQDFEKTYKVIEMVYTKSKEDKMREFLDSRNSVAASKKL